MHRNLPEFNRSSQSSPEITCLATVDADAAAAFRGIGRGEARHLIIPDLLVPAVSVPVLVLNRPRAAQPGT